MSVASFSYQPHAGGLQRYRGIAIVGGLHLLLGWAIVSGTATRSLAMLKQPLTAQVIQEVAIKPPPAPPAPPKQAVKPPRSEPPPFIPQPELTVASSTAPAIVASPTPPPAPVPIAAPAPVVEKAPPVEAPPAAPVRKDMALVCPTQVAPEMPRKALIDGTQGLVRAQALIQGGEVREVTILSGPRIFYAAVRAAMLQYKCSRDSGTVMATQDFNFRLE